jgi:WD40 repeat protein
MTGWHNDRKGRVWSIALSPNSKLVASGSRNGKLKSEVVRCGSRNGKVRLWHVEAGMKK